MTRKVRTGLIGCGSLSLIGILPQLELADAKEWVELVAVCDVVEDRARETAAKFGVPSYYADAQQLIDRGDIELVLVITPIPFHHGYAMAALRAGKHVYVQKTMATTYAEAEEMVGAARERGLVLVAAPGQMLAPAMRRMRELVAEGALGKVYWAWGSTGGWGHDYEPTRHGEGALGTVDPSWYYRRGGGPMRDVTVYVLHSLTGILGPARRVSALSGTALPERRWRDKVMPVEEDDNTLLLLDFGGATFGVAGGHSAATGRLVQWGSMGIYGSAGAIETIEIEPLSGHPTRVHASSSRPVSELGGAGSGELAFAVTGLPYVTEAHAAIPEPHVYADILHCVECIVEGNPAVASGEHAAHVVEIIEKGYEAALTGRTLELESEF